MLKSTRAKKDTGFGSHVEVPAGLYVAGVQFGFLDPYLETIYYVLPQESEDFGKNYVRCRRWRVTEGVYIPGAAKPWNDWERKRTEIPAVMVKRTLHFLRGMFVGGKVAELLQEKEPDEAQRTACRLYEFIELVNKRVATRRNWNVEIGDYLRETELRSWLSLTEWSFRQSFTEKDPIQRA